MNKLTSFSYGGMQQDVSQSLFQNKYYFEGKNIRLLATDNQTTGSIANEKGNLKLHEIPKVNIDFTKPKDQITYVVAGTTKKLTYTTDQINDQLIGKKQDLPQYVIGHTLTREYAILFTTDTTATTINGFDCVWKVNLETYDITLLYIRDLSFSILRPIQAINNYENKSIDKIYWVDGLNQVRSFNIEHSIDNKDLEELIDLPISSIDMVGEYDISQPKIIQVLNGGVHTSGMIQYAYNLYKVNYSQTKLSPFSELISLDKDNLGGGALNEYVGRTPIVRIDNIDPEYSNIKVYAIKYTSYNEDPTISLIDDREIPNNRSIEIYDDGSTIASLTTEELIFIGSDILIPRHINSKDSRLFMANYNEINLTVELDMRAYSFDSSGKCYVYDNINAYQTGDPGDNVNGITGDRREIDYTDWDEHDDFEDKFDSINLDYNKYRYQPKIPYNIEGGEGKYIEYELLHTRTNNPDNKYFKDDEIYRIGIQFYNKYSQITLPIWVADFKAPKGNLESLYNILSVKLKPAFFTWLNQNNFKTEYDKPVGWKVLIAERTVNDRTIVANGIVTTMMANDKSDARWQVDDRGPIPNDKIKVRTAVDKLVKLPNTMTRSCGPDYYGTIKTKPLQQANDLNIMTTKYRDWETEINAGTPKASETAVPGLESTGRAFFQYNTMMQIHSPEILFRDGIQLNPGLELKCKGGVLNTVNNSWGRLYDTNNRGSIMDESKVYGGLSFQYKNSYLNIKGDPKLPTWQGLIADQGGREANRVAYNTYYRGYGDVKLTDGDFLDPGTFVPTIKLVPDPGAPTSGSLYYGNVEEERFYISSSTIGIVADGAAAGANIAKIEVSVTTTNPGDVYTIGLYKDPNALDVYDGQEYINQVGNQTFNNTVTTPLETDPQFPITTEVLHFIKITSTGTITGTVDIILTLEDGVTEVLKASSLANPFSTAAPSNTITPYFIPAKTTAPSYKIYGKPEITEKGQSTVSYNNDGNYKYNNSFNSILTSITDHWEDAGTYIRAIIKGRCDNNRCVTVVLSPTDLPPNQSDSSLTPTEDRPSLEQIYSESVDPLDQVNDTLPIIEIVKSNDSIYLGNIYGGNSFEEKKRTKYIEIGDYVKLDSLLPGTRIDSPGDTFVNFFKFLRVVKFNDPNTDLQSQGVVQWEEIIEVPQESTVDMKNRNDISIAEWDNKFDYEDAEYHKYNRVYSQNPNLISKRNLDYNIKSVEGFDNSIRTTKSKSSDEVIDSWTDILVNETLLLDGKHGAINALPSFKDELYALQDKAIAFLSINPRVQVQGEDGLAIELGTGQVLNDYRYMTTESGTVNKWSVVISPNGIYYFDALNNSFNAFKGSLAGLSDQKGLHAFFLNNCSLNKLRIDNPLIGNGISSGYDYLNNDVFMTFLQKEGSNFTISFNEMVDSFVSFYDYLPPMYISKGAELITVSPKGTEIYKQYAGDYNVFFDNKYRSSITFNVNPEPMLSCVFDNVNFKSEVYIGKADQPDQTVTHIQAYNDYQDSGLVPLVVGRNNNLRRKFRDWNALIPREGRNRIRAPWIKLKLEFDNKANYRLVLHQVNIFYTI